MNRKFKKFKSFIFLTMVLWLVANFLMPNVALPENPQSNDQHHIILMMDKTHYMNKGFKEDFSDEISQRLQIIFSKDLPNILTSSHNNRVLYNKEKDYLSIFPFGLTKWKPNLENNYFYDKCGNRRRPTLNNFQKNPTKSCTDLLSFKNVNPNEILPKYLQAFQNQNKKNKTSKNPFSRESAELPFAPYLGLYKSFIDSSKKYEFEKVKILILTHGDSHFEEVNSDFSNLSLIQKSEKLSSKKKKQFLKNSNFDFLKKIYKGIAKTLDVTKVDFTQSSLTEKGFQLWMYEVTPKPIKSSDLIISQLKDNQTALELPEDDNWELSLNVEVKNKDFDESETFPLTFHKVEADVQIPGSDTLDSLHVKSKTIKLRFSNAPPGSTLYLTYWFKSNFYPFFLIESERKEIALTTPSLFEKISRNWKSLTFWGILATCFFFILLRQILGDIKYKLNIHLVKKIPEIYAFESLQTSESENFLTIGKLKLERKGLMMSLAPAKIICKELSIKSTMIQQKRVGLNSYPCSAVKLYWSGGHPFKIIKGKLPAESFDLRLDYKELQKLKNTQNGDSNPFFPQNISISFSVSFEAKRRFWFSREPQKTLEQASFPIRLLPPVTGKSLETINLIEKTQFQKGLLPIGILTIRPEDMGHLFPNNQIFAFRLSNGNKSIPIFFKLNFNTSKVSSDLSALKEGAEPNTLEGNLNIETAFNEAETNKEILKTVLKVFQKQETFKEIENNINKGKETGILNPEVVFNQGAYLETRDFGKLMHCRFLTKKTLPILLYTDLSEIRNPADQMGLTLQKKSANALKSYGQAKGWIDLDEKLVITRNDEVTEFVWDFEDMEKNKVFKFSSNDTDPSIFSESTKMEVIYHARNWENLGNLPIGILQLGDKAVHGTGFVEISNMNVKIESEDIQWKASIDKNDSILFEGSSNQSDPLNLWSFEQKYQNCKISSESIRWEEYKLIIDRPAKYIENITKPDGVLTLKFNFNVRTVEEENKIDESKEITINWDLIITLGPPKTTFLCIDIGTSAIASVLLDTTDQATSPPKVLPLHDFLDEDRRKEQSPNLISSTIMLSNQIEKESEEGYFQLSPPPYVEQSSAKYLVPYFKKLAGYHSLPSSIFNEDFYWFDNHDNKIKGAPTIESIFLRLFKTLIDDYFISYFNENKMLSVIRKVLITIPNNFSSYHRTIIRKGFLDALGERYKPIFLRNPEIDIEFISESDAVVFYHGYNNKTNIQKNSERGNATEHVICYDIGAGTLDISYVKVNYAPQTEHLRNVEILGKMTSGQAGNYIDYLICDWILKKLGQPNILSEQLEGSSLKSAVEFRNSVEEEIKKGYSTKDSDTNLITNDCKAKITEFIEEKFKGHSPIPPEKIEGLKLSREQFEEDILDSFIDENGSKLFDFLIELINFEQTAESDRKIIVDSLIFSGRTSKLKYLREKVEEKVRSIRQTTGELKSFHIGGESKVENLANLNGGDPSKLAVALGAASYARNKLDRIENSIIEAKSLMQVGLIVDWTQNPHKPLKDYIPIVDYLDVKEKIIHREISVVVTYKNDVIDNCTIKDENGKCLAENDGPIIELILCQNFLPESVFQNIKNYSQELIHNLYTPIYIFSQNEFKRNPTTPDKICISIDLEKFDTKITHNETPTILKGITMDNLKGDEGFHKSGWPYSKCK